MTTSNYFAQSTTSSAYKMPDGKLMSAMAHSPRTITLANQSEHLLRGMAANMPSTKELNSFTPTSSSAARQLPMLPNINLSPSQPIRIARRKPVDLQPRYAKDDEEALLSASPSELKMMYDEATWRMYHLIQTARSEKQAAKTASSAPAPAAQDKYLVDDSFFLNPNTPPRGILGRHASIVSQEDPEEDELVEDLLFELDDF